MHNILIILLLSIGYSAAAISLPNFDFAPDILEKGKGNIMTSHIMLFNLINNDKI